MPGRNRAHGTSPAHKSNRVCIRQFSEILTGKPPLLLQGPDVVGGQKLGERVGVRVEYLLAAVVLQRKV